MPIRFLRWCLGLALPILVGLLVYVGLHRSTFPAPRLTANIAVNEQVHRLTRMPKERVEVLAIGSSMTLNNLASDPVVEHFGTTHYQNAAAWGIGASELELYGPVLVHHFKPRLVIVVTNMMDLQRGSPMSPVDTATLAEHLRSDGGPLTYLRHWNAPYYLRQMETNRIRFSDPGNYEYLGYDAHGGSTLDVPDERIDRDRFDAPPPRSADLDTARLSAFTRFARYLSTHEVDLLVFCSPYRDGLRDQVTDQDAARYVDRLRGILDPMGHRLVNGYAGHWPDSLFSDASHLDRSGAEAFTRWCLHQLEQPDQGRAVPSGPIQ